MDFIFLSHVCEGGARIFGQSGNNRVIQLVNLGGFYFFGVFGMQELSVFIKKSEVKAMDPGHGQNFLL